MRNVDKNRLFPNQHLDGDPDECVGLSVTDIAGNIDGTIYDPDFTYAMTLRLQGVQPTTAGSDPLSGMQSAVAFGLLPILEEDFTSKVMGELYAANWQNYSKEDIQNALTHAHNGVIHIGKDFDAVVGHINAYGRGVSVPMHWYQSFNAPLSNGDLPAPYGSFSNHNIAVYGQNDEGNLICKMWLGPDYGDHGYVYINREIFNQVAQDAFGFNPSAIRWISLLGIIAQRFPAFLSYLPQIISKQK